ncbi:MAG: STAS domain-containing protein [Solirubrobacteraceae bacterium]
MIESILAGTDGPGGTAVGYSLFDIGESRDADGALRLALTGELDLSVTERLSTRLAELRRARQRVRLDLSALEFIDCSGKRAILVALAAARDDGWALEVDRHVSAIAERVIALADLESALWPAGDEAGPASRTAAA